MDRDASNRFLRIETGKLGVNWKVKDQILYRRASVSSKLGSVHVATAMGFISVLMDVTWTTICDMRVLMGLFDWIAGFRKVSYIIRDR